VGGKQTCKEAAKSADRSTNHFCSVMQGIQHNKNIVDKVNATNFSEVVAAKLSDELIEL